MAEDPGFAQCLAYGQRQWESENNGWTGLFSPCWEIQSWGV